MRLEERADVASTVDVAVPRPMADIFAMFGHVHLDILLGEVEAGVAGLAGAKLVHEDAVTTNSVRVGTIVFDISELEAKYAEKPAAAWANSSDEDTELK